MGNCRHHSSTRPAVPYGQSSTGGNDTIGLGGGYTNRPNASGKMSYPKKVNEWFDTASSPFRPQLGWADRTRASATRARTPIVGPGRVNFTTSLYKSFAMTERAHFELRFESFNTFNHTSSTALTPRTTDGNFGQVTNT